MAITEQRFVFKLSHPFSDQDVINFEAWDANSLFGTPDRRVGSPVLKIYSRYRYNLARSLQDHRDPTLLSLRRPQATALFTQSRLPRVCPLLHRVF
jgi:hypothetical protein